MNSRFDGLRSIVGTAAVATPNVEARAVDDTPVAPVAEAPAAPDFPDLSDLDRGLFTADDAVTPSHDRRNSHADDATFAALGRGVDHDQDGHLSEFGAARVARGRQAATRAASDVRRRAPVQADDDDAPERRISGWAAVAVMALGLFLGATAAIAVFRKDVSHIVASWDASPTSSHPPRLQ